MYVLSCALPCCPFWANRKAAIIIIYYVCNNIGKVLHKHVGVGIVVTSGSLHGVMVALWPGMPEMWV